MKIEIFLLTLLSISFNKLVANEMEPLSKYANKEALITEPNIYQVFWNYTETDITFELMTKKSNGWICFGFTSNNSLQDGNLNL
jgi:hypothetical protein